MEFGAWDGTALSNTAALIESGYSAVLIEADTRKAKRLARKYANSASIVTICAMVGWEGPNTLDRLLSATPIPRDFDLLSIDIDGNDFHVWKALEFYRPKIVVVEFNPTIANGVEFVQAPIVSLRHGSSISSLSKLAVRKGYALVATTEYNAFFALEELLPILGLTDTSVERLRTDASWPSEVFFGYDGQMIIKGGRGLEWHRMKLPAKKRMVPRLFMGFPGDFGLFRRAVFKVWRVGRALWFERG